MMTPERWSQIKEIFVAVMDRSPEERQTALSEACHGDLELQAELRQLLAQHDEMGQFLDGVPPASASSLLSPGYVLANRYEIVSLLGMGGMGEVYEVEDKELGGRIALKVIHPQMSFDHAALSRFRREVQIARKITHPNVCRVFDIGHHQQQGREIIFLTMELVDGETLAARLKRVGRIEPNEALSIALQLCQALDASHQAGILHRDFKCGNVMLIGSGDKVRAVVTDFGIARWIQSTGDSATLTSKAAIFGTPAYMSPEQIQGKELTVGSDVYSLGLVLYEMVTGVRPFQNESPWAEALKRTTEDPVSPNTMVSGLELNWSKTILGCLQRDPAKRFASTREVIASLGGRAKLASRVHRHRALGIVALLLVVAMASLAILFRGKLWPSSLPASKHVAVLPFSFVGDDPSSRASAYGLSASLASNLTRLEPSNSSLWMVPWSQVRNWNPADSANAVRSLGVNLLIVGQVEKQPKGLRLRAELKDANTLKNLRSQVIEVPEPEIVTVEDTLLEKVSSLLQVQIPAGMLHHLPVDQTSKPGAYEFYEQGHGYLRHDDPENVDHAISLLQKAIETDPNFAIAYADLGHAQVLKSRYTKDVKWLAQARQACSKALSLNEGLAAAHLALGMVLQDEGNLDSAIGEFRRALTLDPTDDEILRRLALAYDDAGKVLEAESLINDAIKRNPASWVSYNFLGYFYFRHAQYAKAEPLFRAASQLAPDYPLALYNLGGVFLALGKYQEAQSILTRAVTVKPSADAYSNLGTAYFHLGKYKETAAAFLKATDLNPKDHVLWRNLAAAYRMGGDHAKAAQAYQRAIQEIRPLLLLRPKDASLLGELALYHAKLGQRTEASASLAGATRYAVNDPEFLFNATRIYELTGQRERALSSLRAAIRAGYSVSEIESEADLAQLRFDRRYPDIIGSVPAKDNP